jgi:dolichol-phosphate mannosyltransferase
MVPGGIYFIVPVFNEVDNLPSLFESFGELALRLRPNLEPRFIVVDDGSSDGTREALTHAPSDLPLAVLSHATNGGPGAAFATGFHYLAGKLGDQDWVATMEGDNTSRHELVLQMLRRTGEGYDVVLASPYMYGGGMINTSFLRTFLSYGANIFMKEILELRGILTMSSFFRLHRGTIIRRLQACYGPGIVERTGFDCMVEMLMKMVYLDVALSEVAMVLDTSRRRGKSKMKIIRAMRDLLTLVRHKRRWKTAARLSMASR